MAGEQISRRRFLGRTLTAAGVVVSGTVPRAFGLGQKIERTPAKSQNVATDAYNLRMQGKADEAKQLLVQAISKNPHNAAAHYELARAQFHMALANPGKLEKNIADALQSIEKAIEDAPDNVIYSFFAGHIAFFPAYISLQRDLPDTKENFARVCAAFESALKLKPDYHQAMLYLVEIYGVLPEDKGGDKSKAEQYARQLKQMDEVFGAKASSILLPRKADRVDYWQNVLKNHQGNVDVLEELGKAYLRADKVDDAVSCFEQAVRINPEKAILFLDLGRYHITSAMKAMRSNDTELTRTALTLAEPAVTRYIESEPPLPLKAFAISMLGRIKMRDDREQGEELTTRARTMDPYFSKAFGSPNPDLFIPPGEISQNHRYLLRPF